MGCQLLGKRVHFCRKKTPEADYRPDTGLLRKKGIIFGEKKPPEADYRPDTAFFEGKKTAGTLVAKPGF